MESTHSSPLTLMGRATDKRNFQKGQESMFVCVWVLCVIGPSVVFWWVQMYSHLLMQTKWRFPSEELSISCFEGLWWSFLSEVHMDMSTLRVTLRYERLFVQRLVCCDDFSSLTHWPETGFVVELVELGWLIEETSILEYSGSKSICSLKSNLKFHK